MIHLDMVFWFSGILRHDKKFKSRTNDGLSLESRTVKIKSWLSLICLKLTKKWKSISLTTRMIFAIDRVTLLCIVSFCALPLLQTNEPKPLFSFLCFYKWLEQKRPEKNNHAITITCKENSEVRKRVAIWSIWRYLKLKYLLMDSSMQK